MRKFILILCFWMVLSLNASAKFIGWKVQETHDIASGGCAYRHVIKNYYFFGIRFIHSDEIVLIICSN